MIDRPYLRFKAFVLCTALIFLAQGCTTPTPGPAAAATVGGPAYEGLVSLGYSGSHEPLAALRRSVADAGQDAAKLADIESQLVQMLGLPDTTYAGRQAICETLGRLFAISFARGDHPIPPVLVAMLADGSQVDLARMALERAPGASVDAVFVANLGQSSGRVRVALIESIGNRRIASAVPALAAILQDKDSFASAAAARALGQIGNKAAAEVLGRASDPESDNVVEARIRCARNLGRPDGQNTLEELSANMAIAPQLRASALSALLSLDPDAIPQRVASILGGNDRSMKQSVVAWLVALPRSKVLPVINGNIRSWDLETQTGVVAAIGRIGDPSLLPIVMDFARSDQDGLRHAAIVSLGELPGNAEVARLLAEEALRPGEVGSAAKQSLSRLVGSGVDEVVLGGSRQVGSPLRAVYMEELALRDTEGSPEILMAVRTEPDVALRCVALDGLALVGTSDLEAPLLNWMVNATDPTEQSHALRAAAAATFRDRNEKARLKPVADLMGGAPPAVQKRLLTTLSRVGGSEAANYVARFALNEKGPIAESAVEALGHWTDKTGLDPLATVAERAQNEALRTAAIDTAISSLPQNNWELTKEDKAVIARLRALAKDPTLLGRLDALEKPPVK